MDVLQSLRESGFTARVLSVDDDHIDALLEVGDGERRWTFAVEAKGRAPYPNEVNDLESLRTRLADRGEPLLVGPFITEGTGDRLAEVGWSWADLEGNLHLRAPGLLVHRRRPHKARHPSPRRLPHGHGGLAIIRALLGFVEDEGEPLDATGLANQAGVTQPRASQVLGRLLDLNMVTKRDGYWWPNREALLDRFLSEYRGPGGSESYFYSLAEPSEVAMNATKDSTPPYPILVSADVGPDLYAPWLRPRVVILYSRADHPLDDLGLVEAIGRADANVVVRYPQDRSVFAHSAVGTLGDQEIPVADVPQMIWDLEHLGGTDRLEAAGELRKWLLNR
jgi:hypothetical protein